MLDGEQADEHGSYPVGTLVESAESDHGVVSARMRRPLIWEKGALFAVVLTALNSLALRIDQNNPPRAGAGIGDADGTTVGVVFFFV